MGAIREADWLVVGLGNPGPAYARTRHNVGFLVVERLAAQAGASPGAGRFQTQAATADLSGIPILLLKPDTFMNLSGPCVAAWLEAVGLPPERLVVVHDDLDLPLGRLRVTGSAGPGGHRGVLSIQEILATQDFPRVRVGIGRPQEGEDAADRVLEEFTPDELPAVAEMADRAAEAVRTLICHGLTPAMDRYNVRSRASGASA
ncbi:MAG: aminoacyl-tRNA hydrolase [candidate division NC10 bacterium]|nr:aminoacyl-tRNA hydrolase [candidate division NC10 bacterium]MBI2114322.1 aminoacyl-tRNA hydrolase [candidate division NC10 bacterium]MBI2163619.1 aminoacyl-tRNA hydrolase [candidate division NC10 bacterium]MBI2458254.1 aminoacyl-tRNA hydrolase [candidate division NC10 bacterium]MBI3084917.1 aminoacyl-tRNA hydrolase [candidate division NC10 bacterium]